MLLKLPKDSAELVAVVREPGPNPACEMHSFVSVQCSANFWCRVLESEVKVLRPAVPLLS